MQSNQNNAPLYSLKKLNRYFLHLPIILFLHPWTWPKQIMLQKKGSGRYSLAGLGSSKSRGHCIGFFSVEDTAVHFYEQCNYEPLLVVGN